VRRVRIALALLALALGIGAAVLGTPGAQHRPSARPALYKPPSGC
jgi:hypothetical protein